MASIGIQWPQFYSQSWPQKMLMKTGAVLSFKSLFEGVPENRLSSYFTWLNIFAPRFPWDHFWGCRDILKFWGRLRPSEAEANSHIGLIFYMAEYFCALVFMRPFLRLSQHLASASDGLERPRNFKMSRQPQKWSHGNRGAKIFSHVKYELNLWSGTPSNRLLNDKTASNGLKNSLKVMFKANSRICMKKYKFWHP